MKAEKLTRQKGAEDKRPQSEVQPSQGQCDVTPTVFRLMVCKEEKAGNGPLKNQVGVLFSIAKTWKQPKRPSADEWLKKVWYIYTMEYYSAIKKNEMTPYAPTWMDLEMIILSEVRQRKINI